MAIDYSKQFSPRRGSATTMATTKKDIVLAAGELFIEYPDTGVGTGAIKIKIGDGTTDYESLPYALTNDASASIVSFSADTSTTVAEALAEVVSGEELSTIVPALKQAINLLNGEAIKQIVFDGITVNPTNNVATFASPNYSLSGEQASGQGIVELSVETGHGKTGSAFYVTSKDSTLKIENNEGGVAGFSIAANPTGAISNIYSTNLTASKAAATDANGKLVASSVTATELGYLSGTTAAVQTQLNGKQATITGAASSITSSDLTASKALVSDAEGKVAVSSVTATELGYVSGTTAAIQTQINGKSDSNHNHNLDDLNGQLDVTKLWGGATSAKIDIDLIPHGAIENLYIATNEAAIRALTADDVQNGDVVKNQATGVMYFVAHDDQLPIGSEAPLETAFEPFVAGSVEWSAIANKPASVTAAFVGATSATAGSMGLVPAPSTGDEAKYLAGDGTWTSLPTAFGGATSAADGSLGFVPAPVAGDEEKYLCGDGTWVDIAVATTAHKGFMSAQDKTDHDDMVTYFATTAAFDFGDEG